MNISALRFILFAIVCLSSGLLWVACATIAPTPVQEDLAFASVWYPQVDLAMLESGRKHYVNRCGSCHSLYAPQSEPPEEWPIIMDRMAPAAKLTSDMKRDVALYVQTVSAKLRSLPNTSTTTASLIDSQ